MWKELINVLSSIWTWIIDFFNSLSSIISTVISIFKTLIYWATTLFTWTIKLVIQIFEWWVFDSVAQSIDYISSYIWWPATVILMSVLFIIIVRIWIAFVFKILKLNIDYHTKRSQTDRRAVEDMKRSSSLFK